MRNRSLDPNLLQAFIAVADQRSFTRAGIVLNRTQSAISTQIKRLEVQVGLKLLDRTTTRVELSPAGESLVGYARRILTLNEEAILHLSEHEVQGRVRIGVMEDYGATVMPPLLKSFAASYPGVEIQMETGLTSSMTERIGADFDIVIAMHPLKEKTGRLLCREAAVWAGSLQFNVCGADPLPVALYPTGCLFRKWALEALDRCGRPWRLAFVSHSLSAVEAIAAQGLAVTVVKQGVLPESLRVLGRDENLPKLPRAEIRLHTASSLSPAASLLSSHLREAWSISSN